MTDNNGRAEIAISVLITVVGGKACVRRCLEALRPQIQTVSSEIIVPYDVWAMDVGELRADFPEIRFHQITDLGAAASADIPSHQHRLYDRRRAVGLDLTRGRLIAMIEDLAVPAPDWISQILKVHEQKRYSVIGGTIDNAIDRPLNWALYYCDHGRHGSPLPATEAEFVSDINISYTREAIEKVRDVWCVAYHETTVHWALRDRGVVLRLDPALKVHKHRPPGKYWQAVHERVEWGRIFAETRVAAIRMPRRVFFILITPLLPALLLARSFKHMLRQRRTVRQMATSLPLLAGVLVGWAYGELIGYVFGAPPAEQRLMTSGDTMSSRVWNSD